MYNNNHFGSRMQMVKKFSHVVFHACKTKPTKMFRKRTNIQNI